MNLLKHRFVSAKTDGSDPTQIQPSAWNDGHKFSGGNANDVLLCDPTDANYGAKWVGAWTVDTLSSYLTAGSGGAIASYIIQSLRHLVLGKMLHLHMVAQFTVSGSPGTMILTLPVSPVLFTRVPVMIVTGAGNETGFGDTANDGATVMTFYRAAAGAFPTGGVHIYASMIVPLQ